MEQKTIIIADDEPRIRKLVRDFLEKAGYEVIEAEDGRDCLNKFHDNKDKSLKMVILDIMMPNMDGIETIKNIRRFSDVPIIMLTAKDTEEDELYGFKNGADEYISKPFSPKVLVARVNAILKRGNEIKGEVSNIIKGNIELDNKAHIVKVKGKEIDLSYKEFALLEYFMKNENIVLDREKILNKIWDYEYFGDARTVDTHVKNIRSKLGSCKDYITTVWGIGYKFKVN